MSLGTNILGATNKIGLHREDRLDPTLEVGQDDKTPLNIQEEYVIMTPATRYHKGPLATSSSGFPL